MTFQGLVLGVLVASIVWTAILKFSSGKIKNIWVSLCQNFCGILFVISGWVKAIDPLGTAYKMEQYFEEFKGTFEGTSFDFISGLFPMLSNYSVTFSVIMIVLEIIIGIMLILGVRPKLASWLFFVIILFFTALTGFTYLTGYVPSGENFFSFSKWGSYSETNMRVTDCGCFGDFLKIKPKVSFFKDVALLIPALLLILRTRDFHQLFRTHVSDAVAGIATIGLVWYCLSNFAWDLPHTDFRPFAEGLNIREKRQAEIQAESDVQITGYKLKNKSTGQVVELSLEVYLAEMSTKYPSSEWEVLDQIKTLPAIEPTKLSEFVVETVNGEDISDALLDQSGDSYWVVCYKVPYSVQHEKLIVFDSIQLIDTVQSDQEMTMDTSWNVVQSEEMVGHYTFDNSYMTDLKVEVLSAVLKTNKPVTILVGGMDPSAIQSLSSQLQDGVHIAMADDILLKTIIRSNPGLVWLRDGVVMKKWHKSHVPDGESLIHLLQ